MSNLEKTNQLYTNEPMFVDNLFHNMLNFEQAVLSVFQYQYDKNEVYRSWCNMMGVNTPTTTTTTTIPFLPVSFFKTHKVVSGVFEPATIFESSGTTQTINSRHWIKDIDVYEKSHSRSFELFYGDIEDYCVIGLLPSYLERNNSSLVTMADAFIKKSKHNESGFYLHEYQRLHDTLLKLEQKKTKTLLIGVTFALLDFAEAFPMQLQHTIVMETGGMKGRRQEMTRHEVHSFLQNQLGVANIHSEYGMTELLSQAYSKGDGRFICPPWMRVLVRDEEDPLVIRTSGKGAINVIDLANIHSCSFIATDDMGIVYDDGSFEILGRIDYSDIRGCSLMV